MKLPEYYRAVMPYLIIKNASAFTDFIKKVFNAEEKMSVPGPDGGLRHAEFTIGDSTLMIADATDEFKPCPAGMFILVDDVDNTYHTALANGATSIQDVEEKEYGRSAGVEDAFGNQWWITEKSE